MINSEKSTTQNRIVEELQELLTKSINADIQLLKNGSELLQQVAEGKVSLGNVAEQGNEILRQAITDYIRMSTRHTSRLIDLSLDVSDKLVRRGGGKQPQKQATSTRRSPLFELKLNGQAGTLCQTAFVLENNYTEAVTAKFKYTKLVDKAGEKFLEIPIRFDPAEVKLEPEQKQNVVIGIELPADAQTGQFQTVVTVESMPGLNFLVSLTIEASTPAAATQEKKAEETVLKKQRTATSKKRARATTKKRSGKKSAKR